MGSSVLQGAWLGFCLSAPIGPIGVLVLKQALRRGPWAGVASGLGAALADVVYGFLAVAGVQFVAGYGRVAGIAGGLVMLGLALKYWREPTSQEVGSTITGGTAATFLLTLSNPMTIFWFAAMVAGTGTVRPVHFVAGVFLGSMLWWVILSLTAASLRGLIGNRGVVLNRLASITLVCFGVWALWVHGLK